MRAGQRDGAWRRGDEGAGTVLQRSVGEAGLKGVAVLDEADSPGGLCDVAWPHRCLAARRYRRWAAASVLDGVEVPILDTQLEEFLIR